MTRAYNTATTQQNSGGAVAPFTAGKNKIINGDFGIWQRGTSVTVTTNSGISSYAADRFSYIANGSSGTVTQSQQTFTPGTAPVAGYEGQYFLRAATGTTPAGQSYAQVSQRIENVQTLAGQTATFSFWAKATSGSFTVNPRFQQFTNGGYVYDANVGTGAITLTTSWVRYSVTFAVPSLAGKTIAGTTWVAACLDVPQNAAFSLDTWGWQLEVGSTATPFQTATGTLQGELSACQRYFYRFGGLVNNEYFAIGTSVSAGTAIGYASPKVSLRGTPTLSFTTASNYRVIEGTSQTTATSVNAEELSANNISFAFNASGFTIGRANRMNANNTTNGYIDISAEL